MMKLRSIKFCRNNSTKLASGCATASAAVGSANKGGEIKWEVRPGGMLVQKRECAENAEEIITLRVSTVSQCHHISIQATSTFGELKMLMSLMTGLDPKEQRVLYKGKEREDYEYLHMVGVSEKDKVLLLEDPAVKERKLLIDSPADQVAVVVGASYRTISV
ncbi:PREDICTED: BAG family molecular chaperone regulator 3-like [Ipomoea nil]|uniref:BAG family molecular chaperone regulator 3-like n=1 Tax=Ipomoea nil TaxID=35883 RepID=UPI000900AE0D|nr:PREDICTED: BAG family molecular chaperone regulator 3-like [Ipomoea nil]